MDLPLIKNILCWNSYVRKTFTKSSNFTDKVQAFRMSFGDFNVWWLCDVFLFKSSEEVSVN